MSITNDEINNLVDALKNDPDLAKALSTARNPVQVLQDKGINVDANSFMLGLAVSSGHTAFPEHLSEFFRLVDFTNECHGVTGICGPPPPRPPKLDGDSTGDQSLP